MAIGSIPLRHVDKEEFPRFHKHVCPPTFGDDTPDALTPTRRFNLSLLHNFDLEVRGLGKVPMWIIEDKDDSEGGRVFPSKTLRTVMGDIVHARVGASTNTHTIHWHGIEPSPMNDGVGKHSFEISGNYVYQFATNQSGTYFYHCHKNTPLHFEMGLYGALFVNATKPDTPEAGEVPDPPYPEGGPGYVMGLNPPHNRIKYDVEGLWVPDDIDTRWHELGHDAFMQKCDRDDPINPGDFTHNGFLHEFNPDVFVLSGEAKRKDDNSVFEKAAIRAKLGQTILLRFIDASYSIQEIKIDMPVEFIAQDGHPFGVGPEHRYSRPIMRQPGEVVRITAAMRGDGIIHATRRGRFDATIDFIHWISGRKMYTLRTFIEVT